MNEILTILLYMLTAGVGAALVWTYWGFREMRAYDAARIERAVRDCAIEAQAINLGLME